MELYAASIELALGKSAGSSGAFIELALNEPCVSCFYRSKVRDRKIAIVEGARFEDGAFEIGTSKIAPCERTISKQCFREKCLLNRRVCDDQISQRENGQIGSVNEPGGQTGRSRREQRSVRCAAVIGVFVSHNP